MEWISVKDRLPDKSGHYLVFFEDGYMMDAPYSAIHRKFNTKDQTSPESAEKYGFAGITHWMPLPAPPAEYCVDAADAE